jgi:Domain of unknown function (DUF5664)
VSNARKDDSGKLRMDLLPMDAVRDVAAVYTFGAQKYDDENWRKGLSYKRVYGAILRHLTSWFLGEDLDPESGINHLAHAAWGCLTLLNYRHTHPELDDRVKACIHPEAGVQYPGKLVQPARAQDSFGFGLQQAQVDCRVPKSTLWDSPAAQEPLDQADGFGGCERPRPLR